MFLDNNVLDLENSNPYCHRRICDKLTFVPFSGTSGKHDLRMSDGRKQFLKTEYGILNQPEIDLSFNLRPLPPPD